MSTETKEPKADTKKRKDPPSDQGKEKKKEKKQKKKKEPESDDADDDRTIWNESEEERNKPDVTVKNFVHAHFYKKAFSNSFGYEVEDDSGVRKRIDKWKEANKDKYNVSDIVEAVGLHPILQRPLTYFRVYYWDSSLPA
jgi:hypothetical protein